MKIVGISELRKNTSHYIDLVEKNNEIIQVTNYNVLVAEIRPVRKKFFARTQPKKK